MVLGCSSEQPTNEHDQKQIPLIIADPPGGSYDAPLDIQLISQDPNITIVFTVNNMDITVDSPAYTQPIHIETDSKIRFAALIDNELQGLQVVSYKIPQVFEPLTYDKELSPSAFGLIFMSDGINQIVSREFSIENKGTKPIEIFTVLKYTNMCSAMGNGCDFVSEDLLSLAGTLEPGAQKAVEIRYTTPSTDWTFSPLFILSDADNFPVLPIQILGMVRSASSNVPPVDVPNL